MGIFGNERTKRDADEKKFGYEGSSFWKDSTLWMKDGELLHIAIKVGSIVGLELKPRRGLQC